MARSMLGSWGGRAVVGAASVAVLAACSSGATPSSPPSLLPGAPTATASPSISPSPAEEAKTDALAAYRGMWQDFVDAGHTSDWQSSKLGEYATGIALTNLSRSLYADHYNGLVTKGAPVLNPTVSSVDSVVDPIKVIVADCGDSTHWLRYRADNGKFADTDSGGRRAINGIVEKQSDGSWKVSDFGVHEVGSC